jgi:hypothetical protein
VHRPREENDFSSYVAIHLMRELQERGIIVNREVEIRPSRGNRKGERTDIHVDASTNDPRRARRLTVVVEVKGNWHKELATALVTQLSARYLTDAESHHGVYLVGWFSSAKWDPKDDRKRVAEGRDRETVVTGLEADARAAAGRGQVIAVVGLDANL